MKNSLQRQLIMLSKRLLYGFLIQLFLCTVVLANTGNAQRKTIDEVQVSLDLKEKTLLQFFNQVESQTDFKFTYNHDLVDLSQKVTVVENSTVYKVLESIALQTQLNFVQVNENIHVKSLDSSKEAAVVVAQVVDVTVSGTVTDINGEPIPGVTISIPGTSIGTATDLDGNYALSVPEGSTLVFSFIGFETQTIPVGDRSVIDVTLSEDMTSLDEVVVVGYGTVERKDLTGSVGSVPNDEIKDYTISRVDQALVGKLAGVQVKQSTGEPGSAPQIIIRGYNSIDKNASPLFVVDGHPIDNINSLNPNDIERIDVLKDASATAIYGSRGTNGVVLVTTKKGIKGQSDINFSFYTGIQSIGKKVDMMNAREIAQFQYDSFVNRNLDQGNDISGNPLTWGSPVPQVIMDVLNGENTTDINWQDEIFMSSPSIQNYQLSSSGSSEKTNYYISGEYFNQDGIIENSSFDRFSFRINLESQPTEKLKIGARLNPSYSFRKDVTTAGLGGNDTKHIITNALIAQPFHPVYNEGGGFVNMYGLEGAVNNTNPVAIGKLITNNEKTARITGNTYFEYDFLQELKFKALVGIDLTNFRNKYFRPEDNAFPEGTPYAENNNNQNINWLTTFTLNYEKTLNLNHHLNVLLGYDVQKNTFESSSMASDKFPNNLVETLNAASSIDFGSTFENEWSLLSYLGRINYNYNSRYYLTTSLRRDGSSRFGSDNKWGWFPSAAVAWRISEEEFFPRAGVFSDLKLRASFGLTGNNNIGDYLFLPTVSYNGYVLGNNLVGGYAPNRIANPGLQWEQQREYNFGLDIGFLEDRVYLNIDYFNKLNENLLLDVQIPGTTGFTNNISNIGTIENRGLEFSLSSNNLNKNVTWTTNFNISFYRNKILELGPEGDPILSGRGFSHITQIGQPIGMFYGWIEEGVIMNQQDLDNAPIFNPGGPSETRVGDLRFRDINDDGIIDGDDRAIMGSPHPDFIYGMVNNFSFKGFELSVSLQGIQGNEIFGGQKNYTMNTRGRRNQMAVMNNYWKSEESPGNGQIPRPNFAPTGNNRGFSSFYLEDGSFLRINNITLAYNLNNTILEKVNINSARLYISSMNPFTFTNYSNYNPDVSNSESPLTPGLDWNDYPLLRTISVGANIGF